MQEFTAKNSRALYWYCKILLAESIDYTIDPFLRPNGKPAFRLKANVTEEQAKDIQHKFNIFCRLGQAAYPRYKSAAGFPAALL